EAVMSEAQLLSSQIESQVGDKLKSDLVFESADVLIAKKGEKVHYELLELVQEAAKQRLNEIQEDVEARRQTERELLDSQYGERSTEAAGEYQDLQSRMEQRLGHLHSLASEARDELQSLEVLQFLGEPRYRELKQK